MNQLLDFSNPGAISKAIAAGVVSALIALAARYGFQADAPTANAIGIIVTAVVGYVIGHVAVYFSPKNKE